jgi:F-type H+-transporting ATPase subunit delta
MGVTADKVNIVKKVDPSLIGGFILQVGDKLYDASVKSKLAHIKKEFAENTYIKS